MRTKTAFLAAAVAAVFALPEQEAAAPALRVAATAAPGGGRVLVAEDNEVNRLVIATLLERRGLDVDVAGDGAEALATLAPEHRAVFMDCQMPEVDGYEATRRIRAAEALAGGGRLPIIAMTAGAFSEDRDACLQAGMDDYLSKPANVADLADALARWIPSPHAVHAVR